jgi:hypothetical protein
MDGVAEEVLLRTSPIPAFQQVSGGEQLARDIGVRGTHGYMTGRPYADVWSVFQQMRNLLKPP